MNRYVPPFIVRQYEQDNFQGSFSGFALFLDIVDFTSVANVFRNHGKKGAEELSRLLERSMAFPIEVIEGGGGFIGEFAGDAFLAFFPQGDDILSIVQRIEDWFDKNGHFSSEFGEFAIKVRLTVDYGDIHWKIFRNAWQYEYVFHGDTIRELVHLASYKKELIFSRAATAFIGLDRFEPTDVGYVPMGSIKECALPHKTLIEEAEIPEAFINKRFRNDNPGNEIRDAAFCFTDLTAIESSRQEETVGILHELADRYGGFVNKLDATDKGLIALILFGMPRTEGNTLERICEFAMEALSRIRGISLSISCGSVFAGYIGHDRTHEYTALGYAVNLAARLIARARLEEVLCDTYIWQEMHTQYDFDYMGSLSLKGFSTPIKYYKLNRQMKKASMRFRSRFVGRKAELEKIIDSMNDCCRTGKIHALYLVGEAGIGKTRLLEEAFKDLSLDQFHKFVIHCDSLIQKPLEPLRKLIKTYFYYNPDMPAEMGKALFSSLWNALPADSDEKARNESIIGSLLGYQWENSTWEHIAPLDRNQELKEAFSWFVSVIAGQKSVILNIDDAQWLDERSIEFLQHLSLRVVKPVQIVLSCRYLSQGEKLDLRLKTHRTYDIELGQMPDDGCTELIQSVLRIQDVPRETIRLIRDRSMGNPLFTEQLAAFLQENGNLDYQGNLKGTIEYISTFGISDIIGSRIDRMDESVRDCIFSASVLGMEFSADILRKMLGADIDEKLRTGKTNRIWFETSHMTYEFSHILIRETVYQRMMSDQQAMLHLAAAHAMEKVHGTSLAEKAEEIGLHYEYGLDIPRAIEYYTSAASYYKKKYELSDAAKLLLRIISLMQVENGTEQAEISKMHDELASVYYLKGDYDQALVSLQTALSLSDTESREAAVILDNMGSVYLRKGNHDEALACFRRALDIHETIGDSDAPDSIAPYINIAKVYKAKGDSEQALEIYFKALKTFEKTRIPTDIIYQNIGQVYYDRGDYDQALQYFQMTLDQREKNCSVDHPLIADIYHNLASVYKNLGDYDRSLEYYLSALRICEKRLGREHPQTGSNYNNIAWFYKFRGDFEKALDYYNRALEINLKRRGPEHPFTAISLGNIGSVYMNLGKYDKALESLQRGLEIQEKKLGADHPDTAGSYYSIASVYRNMGELEKALDYYERSLIIREERLGRDHPLTAVTCHMIGFTHMEAGAFKDALAYYDRALKIQIARFGEDHPQVAVTNHNIGTAYLKSEQYEKALEHYLKALGVNEKKLDPSNHRTGIVHFNIGKTLMNMNRTEEAKEHLQKALPILQQADDDKLEECTELLTRINAR